MVRVFFASCFVIGLLSAHPQASKAPPQTQSPKPAEDEPPEEDESLKPKEYTLNPVEADRNLTAGNFYLKKGNYVAASRRYREATLWNPASSEAFLKLAESNEKAKDFAAARDAYTKYLALVPDAKNAAEIKKKMAKWPASAASVK